MSHFKYWSDVSTTQLTPKFYFREIIWEYWLLLRQNSNFCKKCLSRCWVSVAVYSTVLFFRNKHRYTYTDAQYPPLSSLFFPLTLPSIYFSWRNNTQVWNNESFLAMFENKLFSRAPSKWCINCRKWHCTRQQHYHQRTLVIRILQMKTLETPDMLWPHCL